jgi:hypothetical protein
MSDTLEGGDNDAHSASAGLRQFLQNVHGYTEPPTIWQLSQLAAMVGTNVPDDHSCQAMNEAHRRVALAAHIWDAAALKLREIQHRLDRTRGDFEARNPLFGPLKIGGHFMPRITGLDTETGYIPLKQFLELVIGLAREDASSRGSRAW